MFSQEGEYITMWTDMNRPLVLDGEGSVLARWPSRSAHGSWVDAHGDIYLALTAEQSVDKYIRQS